MSHRLSTGELNPAFQINDEDEVIWENENDVSNVHITSNHGDISNREESIENDNKYNLFSYADIKVSGAVLLQRQNMEEEYNKSYNTETSKSNTDDIRITISGPPFLENEQVLGIAQTETVSDVNGPQSSYSELPQNEQAQSLGFSLSKTDTPHIEDEKDEDAKWLACIKDRLKGTSGHDFELDLKQFQKALGVKKSFFSERFFELFEEKSNGAIKLDELMDGLRMLIKGTPEEKLKFLFDVYDADAIGCIGTEEFTTDLRAYLEESSLALTECDLNELTDILSNVADDDESGTITFEELIKEMKKHPHFLEILASSASLWLRPAVDFKKNNSVFRYFKVDYWRHNTRKVGYFVFYWILHIILIAVAMWHNSELSTWATFAKTTGFCLNFNCMWVVVPMLRNSLTYLRTTKLARVLPLDQHTLFHIMTAWTIVGLALIHTMSHIANSAYLANANAVQMWKILTSITADVGYLHGSAYVTGWLLVVTLIVIVICSMSLVRQGGCFQVFYWTHKLYFLFWILLILHGPNFWKWSLAPGVLFIMEKVSRSKVFKMVRYGNTFIEEVNLLHSGVTHLVITRPTKFCYQSGDYIFIQIPDIATYEWHPFSISSAPEMEGHIWLHVRSAGRWTNKLYKYFENLEETEDAVEALTTKGCLQRSTFEFSERAYPRHTTRFTHSTNRTSRRGQTPKQKHKVVQVRCYIDGPYGTGTREALETNHAVLIAAGIGVTPMASVLQSVLHRFNVGRQKCPRCDHLWYSDDHGSKMKLKKVDFIWINRDPKNFEWFLPLLSKIESEQSHRGGKLEDSIRIHLYSTAAQKNKTELNRTSLQTAHDLVTDLRTKIAQGRPDWYKIFKAIKNENVGKVKVFFCGAPALAKTLKELSTKHKFAFVKENFY